MKWQPHPSIKTLNNSYSSTISGKEDQAPDRGRRISFQLDNDDSIDGRKTTSQMKQGESLVRKELAQKYKEMSGDIDF